MEEKKDYQVKTGYILNTGWGIFKQSILFLMLWCIVLLLPYIVYEIMKNLGILPAMIKKFFSFENVISLIYIVWFWFWWAGTFTVLKKTLQEQPCKLQDILINTRYLTSLIAFYFCFCAVISLGILFGVLVSIIIFLLIYKYSVELLTTIAVMIGLPCLVFITVLFIFAPLLIVDRQVKVGRAMTISRKTVWHKWANIFFLLLTVLLITVTIFVVFVILWAFFIDIYPSFTKYPYYKMIMNLFFVFITLLILCGYGTSVILVAYHDIFGLKSNNEGSSIGNLA